VFWSAATLAAQGQYDTTLPMWKKVFADDPRWIEMTKRLVAPGLLDRATADRVLRDAQSR